MKRIVLLTFILLLTFSSIGFADTPWNTYKNTEFQFEISYPHDWTEALTTSKEMDNFYEKKIGDLMVEFWRENPWTWMAAGVIVNRIDGITSNDPYKDKSLDSLIARSMEHRFYLVTPPELVSKSMVTVKDTKAMKVILRFKQNAIFGLSPELLDETYFIFHNNCWYEISLNGTPDDFKNNRSTLEECLKSFKLLDK